MKVVIVDGYHQDYSREIELYRQNGVELVAEHVGSDEECIEKCKDADGLIVMMRKIGRNVIEKLDHCKMMIRHGVGFDNFDVEAATEKGIAVCNVPRASTEEVATQAVALALDCVRQITYNDRLSRAGKQGDQVGLNVRRLSGQTFGLCGFGGIARAVAVRMRGFGCKIIAYDPYVDDAVFAEMGVERVTMEQLCRRADILSVHIPMSDATYHTIAKPQFDMMKKGVIFVNTARGGVVSQSDLCDALDAGIVKAAGLDVLETEPIIKYPNERILGYEQVVITPHCGGAGLEANMDMRACVFETPLKILRGEAVDNIVNKQALGK